jgi:hypothetical protein
MSVIDIAAAAFAALPKINRVWVDAKGHFHLHPDNGGTLVERAELDKPTEPSEPQEKPKGKKKK